MYLSRLKLDPSLRKTRELLISPYTLHQSVYRAFPDKADGGPSRVLYRLDPDRRSRTISLLVQSEKSPHWERADYLGECLRESYESKPYNPTFPSGQRLSFRLRANPTVKKQAEGKNNGYRLGLLREEDQVKWLERKAITNGFSLLDCRVVPEGIAQDDRGRAAQDKVRHFGVLFEGTLKVTDPIRFVDAIRNGIGPAKGFGFGLLSVTAGPPVVPLAKGDIAIPSSVSSEGD